MRLSGGRKYRQLSISDLMQVKYLLYTMSDIAQSALTAELREQLNATCQLLFNSDFESFLKKHSKETFVAANSQEDIAFYLK